MSKSIKAIDKASVHRITSGQVVVDLQTAVKELLENSMDGGATNVEIRFKQYGLKSIEVVDNGCGIAEEDHESIALKHHTSKLESFSDLTSVLTFGFRGEALSSLCALSEEVAVSTATSSTTPMGAILTMDSSGRVQKRSKVARNQGTTISLTNIFKPLPVRRKELERNAKREFGKALSLLTAYALGPCRGIRLAVSNQLEKGPKNVQIQTLGSSSHRASVAALWGAKALDNIVDMDLSFEVEREKSTLKRLHSQDVSLVPVNVKGLISKFAVGSGRSGNDRQFFYVNGRPCNMSKIQKAFNEVYKSFNATQSPFILADFILPTDSYDVNVSPDKRTILLHNESNLISALKATLEVRFAPSRATYDLGGGTQSKTKAHTQTLLTLTRPPSQTTEADSQQQSSPEEYAQGAESQPPDLSQATSFSNQSSTAPTTITLHGHTSSPSSPSPPPQPSISDLIPTKAIPAPTDTQDDDIMDIDVGNKTNPPSKPRSVILDTSQTAWGHHLGITPSPSSPIVSDPGAGIERNHVKSLSIDDVQTRKKRKSDVGAIVTRRDRSREEDADEGEDVDAVDVQSLSVKTAPSSVARTGVNTRTSTRSTTSLSKTLSMSALRKSTPKPRTTLRSQLVGFALPGSQLSAPSLVAEEDEDMELIEEEEPEEDQEERDQLDEEDDNDQVTSAAAPERLFCPEDEDSSAVNQPSLSINGAGDSFTIDDDEDDPTSVLSQVRTTCSTTTSTISLKDQIRHPEIIRSEKVGGDISLRFDLNRIKKAQSRRLLLRPQANASRNAENEKASVPTDAGVYNLEDDAKAASALARVIEKHDFAQMEVVGQFNLGFIIARRRKPKGVAYENAMDDLFIVDQHAADEKYNFETLQATTKIQSQKLFRPQPVELTAADEMLALENMDVLQQNGFEIDVNEAADVGNGSRLKLTAQPASKSTVFDMKDLEEVIHLLRDRPAGQMVRCSKARSMFAMRACRKSVMVGLPLTLQQMTTVIRHMGTMEQPWNCPHGRPTMRHLSDMRSQGTRPQDSIDWAAFC